MKTITCAAALSLALFAGPAIAGNPAPAQNPAITPEVMVADVEADFDHQQLPLLLMIVFTVMTLGGA